MKWLFQILGLSCAAAAGILAASVAAGAIPDAIVPPETVTAADSGPTTTIATGSTLTVQELDIFTVTRPLTETGPGTTTPGSTVETPGPGETVTEVVTIQVAGPQGPQGEKGEKGDKGDKGEPGQSASDECQQAGGVFQAVTVNTPGGQQDWLVCVLG